MFSTTTDSLHRLAFDNSLQANIITIAGSGKIIMVNNAACKLLGYSKKELLTKSRSNIFKLDETAFKKMLKQRTADGHSLASLTVIKKTGTLIPCEITSAVFIDEGVKKAITSIVNLSGSILKQKNIDKKKEKIVADNIALVKSNQKIIDIKKEEIVANDIALVISQQKIIDIEKEQIVSDDIVVALAISDARLVENNEWIKYIAMASYDVMWDWDIASGELYAGESIEEVFGYKISDNKMQFNDFMAHIHPDEKSKVEKKLAKVIASRGKKWDDAFLFRRHDGSVASTICRASIVRDEKGKAIRLIGAIQDISKLQELEKKLEAQNSTKNNPDLFQLAAKLCYDGIWDWNLVTNEFFLGEGFEDLFGFTIKNNMGNMADWSKHLHPDDKEAVEKGLQDAITSKDVRWEHTYRFIRADGSVAEVLGRANIIRDANKKAIRMIGAVHDISKQRVLEEKLAQEIKLKELRIAEAAKDAKETERADIGKELHDNVNQLLGASKMYLDLAKAGGDNSALFMSRSSEYMIKAIEEIRKLTKGLTTDIINNLGLCMAIDNIVQDTMEINPVRISCSLDKFIEDSVGNKFKLNVYRIIQEHLNNILKHAKAMKIAILLAQNKKSITLKISDNGVGFDTSKRRKGIGVDNIKSRATSYNGKAHFISHPGQGCVLNVTFPLTSLVAN